MAFWTSEKLKEKASIEELIRPYNENRVKHGAYEMSLGHEAFITSDKQKKKQPLADGEQLVIPPGQFGLLITTEEIRIPADAMGFISIKAGIKFSGLVNISGFHVDPGFSGKLKFSVYNAGSRNVILASGQNVFLIWFSDLDRATSDLYSGDHANQKEISSQDVMRIQGEVHSPAAIDKRLTDLENIFSTIKTIAMTIGGGLVVATIVFVANHFWDKKDTVDTSSSIAQPGLRPETSPKSTTEIKSQPQSTSSIPVREQNKVDGGTQKRGSQEPKNVSPEQESGGNAQGTKGYPKHTTYPSNKSERK